MQCTIQNRELTTRDVVYENGALLRQFGRHRVHFTLSVPDCRVARHRTNKRIGSCEIDLDARYSVPPFSSLPLARISCSASRDYDAASRPARLFHAGDVPVAYLLGERLVLFSARLRSEPPHVVLMTPASLLDAAHLGQ